MLLLLVRHADAGDRDPAQWSDDTVRPLTEKGRKVHAKVTRALHEAGLVPELILASPWLRAAQTAEVMTQELGLAAAVPCPPLAADPDLHALDAVVGPRKGKAVVALVGHSPWIEELGAMLLTGTPKGVAMDFPKSGVLAVEAESVSAGAGILRFFLRPKMV
ncbi:MAG TPA: histidine phosphatase family protein [Gemmatimonadales bacterium]|jgi:phosphohistidine phosphatase